VQKKHDISIELATPGDRDAILNVAVDSGLFEPEHLDELAQTLDSFFRSSPDGQHWLVARAETTGQVEGAAYVAPEPMTDGTHNLYFIAVSKDVQAGGLGTRLLRRVEELVREHEARILLVETSGQPEFELTRRFYRKNGYDEEARIRDFYADGDDKVVFRKAVSSD